MNDCEQGFGFYPYEKEFNGDRFEISLHTDFQDSIEGVIEDNRIFDGWFYPPLIANRPSKNEPTFPIKSQPDVWRYASGYQLPPTHVLRLKKSKSQDRCKLLIVTFGFVLGLHTIPVGWNRISRVPINEHRISDLILSKRNVEALINGFDKLYADVNKYQKNLMFSTMHAYQWSFITDHWFERFSYLCMSLDALASVYNEFLGTSWRSRNAHGKHPGQWSYARDFCMFLGVPCPKWAQKLPNVSACKLSIWRNSIVHEASLFDQPFGFALKNEFFEAMHQLQHLIFRAFIYLSGVRCQYTSSAVTTRMMHGLDPLD